MGDGASNKSEQEAWNEEALPEKVLQEFVQEAEPGPMDDHLVEFSEALGTVAKALRVVAEGKARALEEAAEWKRKYELECQRSKSAEVFAVSSTSKPSQLASSQTDTVTLTGYSRKQRLPEQNGGCCGKEGICSHAVLDRSSSDLNSQELNKLLSRKVSFNLAWGCDGVKDRQRKHDVVSFERGNITTALRSNKQIILEWNAPPRSVAILAKPNSAHVHAVCMEMVKWLKEYKGMDIFLEPRVRKELLAESSFYDFVQSWETEEEVQTLHTKVDLVITLGGDGTVLWAASLFKGPVPPLVSFAMGSLGFMTPFQSENYQECMRNIIRGPLDVTLRHRLNCQIVRAGDRDESGEGRWNCSEDSYLVLNEVSIDRGMSSFLTFLECYCNNFFVTTVQGDGLIISTTSGSTAYSLAAGGSMVHPQVPGILFTPICPHSLSFRPLILPEYVTLRVQVPSNSRGQAWASFDGKDRQQLQAGDALLCKMSQWPVPTMSAMESTHDFLRSVREGLHWNMRKSQSTDGPRDGHVMDPS